MTNSKLVCVVCHSGGSNIPFITAGPRLRPFALSKDKFDILKNAGYNVEIVDGFEVDENGQVITSTERTKLPPVIDMNAEEVVTEEAEEVVAEEAEDAEEVVAEEAEDAEEVVAEEAEDAEEVVTEEAVTEEVVTEEAVTEEVVAEEAVTEEAVTEEAEFITAEMIDAMTDEEVLNLLKTNEIDFDENLSSEELREYLKSLITEE